jgi:hypothetical protein
MPDWQRIIHARLDLAGKHIPCDEETVAELAAHLGELFDRWQKLGLSEEEAIGRTLAEVTDWEDLFLKIRRARSGEDIMTVTSKSIWIPGIVALLGTLCGLVGAFRNDLFPSGFRLASDISLFVYVPWLGAELLVGFIAGYVSKRMGGQRHDRWAVAGFVSVALIILFFGNSPVNGVIVGPARTWTLWGHLILYALSCFFLWVVVPSLVLVAGMISFWNFYAHLPLKNKMTTESIV